MLAFPNFVYSHFRVFAMLSLSASMSSFVFLHFLHYHSRFSFPPISRSISFDHGTRPLRAVLCFSSDWHYNIALCCILCFYCLFVFPSSSTLSSLFGFVTRPSRDVPYLSGISTWPVSFGLHVLFLPLSFPCMVLLHVFLLACSFRLQTHSLGVSLSSFS